MYFVCDFIFSIYKLIYYKPILEYSAKRNFSWNNNTRSVDTYFIIRPNRPHFGSIRPNGLPPEQCVRQEPFLYYKNSPSPVVLNNIL